MKKIGSGWAYNVYDYGVNRVLKRRRPYIESVFRIVTRDPRKIFSLKKTLENIDKSHIDSFKVINKLKETNFDFNKIANPILINQKDYSQDKCTPFYKILRVGNEERIKEAIDQYIEQIKYFWKYGFADVVYNFATNNGIGDNGKLALFDFNEITTEKELVLRDIKNKVWLKRDSFKFFLNKNQKAYFKKRMEQEITPETLENLWGTNKKPLG